MSGAYTISLCCKCGKHSSCGNRVNLVKPWVHAGFFQWERRAVLFPNTAAAARVLFSQRSLSFMWEHLFGRISLGCNTITITQFNVITAAGRFQRRTAILNNSTSRQRGRKQEIRAVHFWHSVQLQKSSVPQRCCHSLLEYGCFSKFSIWCAPAFGFPHFQGRIGMDGHMQCVYGIVLQVPSWNFSPLFNRCCVSVWSCNTNNFL